MPLYGKMAQLWNHIFEDFRYFMHWNFASDMVCFQALFGRGKIQAMRKMSAWILNSIMYKGFIFSLPFNFPVFQYLVYKNTSDSDLSSSLIIQGTLKCSLCPLIKILSTSNFVSLEIIIVTCKKWKKIKVWIDMCSLVIVHFFENIFRVY